MFGATDLTQKFIPNNQLMHNIDLYISETMK